VVVSIGTQMKQLVLATIVALTALTAHVRTELTNAGARRLFR
jgi:hypothetical protein